MSSADSEVDRYLTLLRNKIREHGFTQLEVQEALGWGRSYISQLLTKQKALRVEQVLLVLDVIGLAPPEFFAELYLLDRRLATSPAPPGARDNSPRKLRDLSALVRGLADLLLEKDVISDEELTAAARAADQESMGG